jgi:transcriptional regulator with XRE-family HTH domain
MKLKTLQQIRESKTMSQRELALAAHVSLTTINRIETGKTITSVMPKTKRAIATALGVPPETINW